MYCSACGKENGEGKKFCKYCGTKLKQRQVAIVDDEPFQEESFEEIELEKKPANRKSVNNQSTNKRPANKHSANQKQGEVDIKKRNFIFAIGGLSIVVLALVVTLVVIIVNNKKEKSAETSLEKPMVEEPAADNTEPSVEVITEDAIDFAGNEAEPTVILPVDDANGIIYRKWLAKFMDGFTGLDAGTDMSLYADGNIDWYFTLKDINDDGVVDLLLDSWYQYSDDSSLEYSSLEFQLEPWYMMTIVDGECAQQARDILCYDSDEKNLYSAFFSEGASLTIEHVANGEYTTVDEYFAESGSEGYIWYHGSWDTNSSEMTSDESNKVLSDFIKKQKECPFDGIPLTRENIDKYMPVSDDMRTSLSELEEQNKSIVMFNSFLTGEGKVRIGNDIAVGYFDFSYSDDTPKHGYENQELTLSEMKDIIVNGSDIAVEGLDPDIYYSVLNINDNNIFLLKFENVGIEGYADDGTETTFVIARRGEELVATYSFDSYGRGGASANKYGVIWSGGSAGAGDHMDDEYYIDENGDVNCLYRSETCGTGWINKQFEWFKKDYFSQQTIDIAALYDSSEIQDQGGFCIVTLYEINGQIYGEFESEADFPGFTDLLVNAAAGDGLKLYTGKEVDDYALSLGFDKSKRELFGDNEPEWHRHYGGYNYELTSYYK